MDVWTDISRQRVLRGFAAVARQKALQNAERAGWPLPRELAVHLQLLELALLPPSEPWPRPS